ncbi:MAG: hypothetical protein KQI35_00800 [Bacteroidetes bacterium]|nr:hypothetical protein [Bacteroidota bacterium]
MRSLIGIIILLVALGSTSWGQEESKTRKDERRERDKYLGLGTGFSYVKVTDNNTSPLRYKGITIPANLSFLVHSEKIIKSFETDFSYGNLTTPTELPWYNPTNTSYYISLRYNILYRFKQLAEDRINWYLGPEFNINGHFRVNYKYGNSAFTFDNYNGIGLATRFEFPFHYRAKKMKLWFIKLNRRDRDLRLSWQLSTPFVSFMIRPTYVTITNFIDPDLQSKITADHISGGFFVPFNLRSQTELHYILHNGNAIRLSYVWNFFHHDPGYNKVQSAYHGLTLSLLFKFNNNSDKQ